MKNSPLDRHRACPVPELERFRFDGERNLFDQSHFWVSSGMLSVSPSLMSVGSVRSLYSPPWAATGFRFDLRINGAAVPVDDFRWYPNEVQRCGCVGSIDVHTSLLPLVESRAFVQLVRLENRGRANQYVEVSMRVRGDLDRIGAGEWSYDAPKSATTLESSVHEWRGDPDDDLRTFLFRLENDHGAILAAMISDHPEPEGADIQELLTLRPGIAREVKILVVLGDQDEFDRLRSSFEHTLERNSSKWSERVRTVLSSVPELETDHPALQRFYDRGVLTLLTSRWELPDLVTYPHYSVGGIDGGGFCSYVWDFGYMCEFFCLVQPATARAMIERFLAMDLTQFFAYSPLDGSGIGRWYAYNNYNVIRGIYYYVLATGDTVFLSETAGDKTVLEWVVELARWPGGDTVELVDYGLNANILELQKTDAYEHYVPSPNGERFASYRMAAALARLAGVSEGDLEDRAQQVRALILEKLWKPEHSWMASLDLDGNEKLAYSIQVFDLLRLYMLPDDVSSAIVTHLNDREFLSEYGLHSLSRLDPGYDERDVDWGGPGSYAGDAPELVRDLYVAGFPEQAEDLLRRILWWGDHFPYIPQAIRADRIDYRHDGLSNILSGACVPQAIVSGVFGVALLPDNGGSLQIRPHVLSFAGEFRLSNLRWRQHVIAIRVHGDSFAVEVDGVEKVLPMGEVFVLP